MMKIKIFAVTTILIISNLVCLPAVAKPFSSTYYVQIDHKDNTAFIFDKDFKQLPEATDNQKTSAINFPRGNVRWYLGNDSAIVRRNSDGSIQDLSAEPAYSEMNHHIVFHYFRDIPQPPKRGKFKNLVNKGWNLFKDKTGIEKDNPKDEKEIFKGKVCGQFPFKDYSGNLFNCYFLAPSSEFTKLRLPKGYGMKVNGGFIKSKSWHWDNPSGIAKDEKIYVRLVMHWDDYPTGFREVFPARVVRDESQLTFCAEPGPSEILGKEYEVDRPIRLVSIVPHIHDHAKYLELRVNGRAIHRFTPKNASIPTKHSSCDGKNPTDLHTSPDHLPAGGLTAWSPGANGPTLKPGDKLQVFGSFSNPHDRPIDNMIVFRLFWENL